MSSIVAIVGRPNVGKSTLFNRLSRSRSALVDDQPGVTRDRLYAIVRWAGTTLTIVDTGGFEDSGREVLLDQVREQVVKAVDEADRIIFMVDGRQGIMPGDEDMADVIRRSQKKFFLAVNKIDGPEHDHLALDFYKLGVDKTHPISAAHGYGLKAFMEEVIRDVPDVDARDDSSGRVRVAVLGRPNVGKSSLINRVLGSDRLLVSELPGTTRDSVDISFSWQGKDYLLIDTAGIRKKGRVKEKIEKFSMIKALRSLDRCHVAVILLDASAGIADQDARICGYAFERARGLILAVNKWDLVKKDPEKRKRLNEAFERHFKFVSFAPRLDISALTGERVRVLFGRISQVYDQYCRRVGTGSVNRALKEMIQRRPPPDAGARRLRLLYATQISVRPPTFVVFVNKPEIVHFSYKRFVINQFRERLDLTHTPIRLIFKKK